MELNITKNLAIVSHQLLQFNRKDLFYNECRLIVQLYPILYLHRHTFLVYSCYMAIALSFTAPVALT